MSDRGPLVPQLTLNPKNIFKNPPSLALIMKKYHANLGVNRMENGAAIAASVFYLIKAPTNWVSKAYQHPPMHLLFHCYMHLY